MDHLDYACAEAGFIPSARQAHFSLLSAFANASFHVSPDRAMFKKLKFDVT